MTNTQTEERIIQISTAWLIGLGYKPPTYTASHSKEYLKQIEKLITKRENALLERVEEEIVGKDVDVTDRIKIVDLDCVKLGKNELRAEQRKKLKAIKNEQ